MNPQNLHEASESSAGQKQAEPFDSLARQPRLLGKFWAVRDSVSRCMRKFEGGKQRGNSVFVL